ncbi:hypothetical protein ACFLQU_03790 [Verrucomicrobiota bacterium]
MGLFDRKPKVSIQQWCNDFYSSSLFAPPIGGADPWELFCNSVRDQVAQADPTFLQVDGNVLSDQMLALRLEVIGIAWILRVKDDFSPRQSLCTQQYLTDHNQDHYWEMMGPFNQAVAKATVAGSDGNTAAGRAHITFMNSMRTQLFDKWSATVSDPKHAARAANRIGSDVPWKAHKTHIYLSFALTDQLQCEVNEEARKKLMAVIQGFFDGTSEELKKVKIVPGLA